MTEQTTVPATTAPVKTPAPMTAGGAPASKFRPTRWDPIEMLEDLQGEMSRLWGEAWSPGPWTTRRPLRRLFQGPTTWAPRVDVYQKDGQLVVQTELPGVKKEDAQVAIEDGDLVIRGERKSESEVKEEDYYRLERSAGTFYRRLPLGGEVKAEQITAKFADGVLEVTMTAPVPSKPAATAIPIA
jgi:HSP20 family protein